MTRIHVIHYHKKKRLYLMDNLNATIDDHETSNDEFPNAMVEEEHLIDSIFNHEKQEDNCTYLIRLYGRYSSDDSLSLIHI